ncbi:hypothetical protein AB0F91_36205 [Amycolatopsis sp. NPDC023774]|uniref:hypothetical protein n=1 Tax=Amycolatopsis sp. NPDC023774 TaxID=3155015 RepID=UPI0033C81019
MAGRARLTKGYLEGFFRAEAERGNVTDPDFLTCRLAVLCAGGGSRADDLRGLAVATARTLPDAAGVTD